MVQSCHVSLACVARTFDTLISQNAIQYTAGLRRNSLLGMEHLVRMGT